VASSPTDALQLWAGIRCVEAEMRGNRDRMGRNGFKMRGNREKNEKKENCYKGE